MTTAAIETFADREQWLGARGTGLGSSDAPVILGLSKWKSPLALYYEKRGLREPSHGEREFMEWGLALEPAIIKGYERVTRRKVADPTFLFGHFLPEVRFTLARDAELPFLVASPDAAVFPVSSRDSDKARARVAADVPPPPVFDEPGVLEVKNVDISKGKLWEDAQEPPVEYLVQVQHQLMVTGAQWGSIAALVGGNRFMWADVPRDEELIAMIRKLEIEFWKACLKGEPPPVDGSNSTKDVLARLYPKDTGELVTLPPEALEWDKQARFAAAQMQAAKAIKQEADNKLRAAIGDASVGEVSPEVSYSWRWQSRRAHSVKASEYRVLRRHGVAGEAEDDE